MTIRGDDVAGPEGPGRIEGQMDLQVAAGEPGAGTLEGRPFNDPEAEKVLIEGERPREIGHDEINMVERKLSHKAATITRWLGKTIRPGTSWAASYWASHLSLGEGDYGLSDLLAVRRFDLIGPAIFGEVITVTVVSTIIRRKDICPILLW